MTRLLTLTLLALAVLAAPAAAEVPTIYYHVSIDGTADYNRADVDDDTAVQHDIGLKFRTEIPRLRFTGRLAEDSRGALGTASATRGSYVISGGSGIQVRCLDHTVGDTTGGGLDGTFGEHGTIFATRVIDSMLVDVGGCEAPMTPWKLPMGSGGHPVGIGIFDGSFTVPHSRVGEASMTFPLSGEVTGGECPFNHFNTVMCSLTWNAVVTFTRLPDVPDPDDDLLVPIVPDPEPKPQPPAEPVAPREESLLVPISAKPRISANLASASLPFQCDEACKGTLTAKARGKTLAKTAVKGVAGKVTTALVRFDRRDRVAIKRAKAVQLTLAVRSGARTFRQTVTVRPR